MLSRSLTLRKNRVPLALARLAAVPLGTAATALLAALPAVLCGLYVRAYGVDVPFWDEWGMVSLPDRIEAGRLSFADLFRPHSEHRIFGLVRLTGYDTRAAMYAGWLAQCASAVILLLLFARGERSWRGVLFKFIPASCLMFSLRQTDNLLWGFQLGIFLPPGAGKVAGGAHRLRADLNRRRGTDSLPDGNLDGARGTESVGHLPGSYRAQNEKNLSLLYPATALRLKASRFPTYIQPTVGPTPPVSAPAPQTGRVH